MINTCNPPNICPPGQFNAVNVCYPCENSCTECYMKNIFDYSTYTCTKCSPGFQLQSEGQQSCIMTIDTVAGCPVGTYLPPPDPVTKKSAGCEKCPDNCVDCSVIDSLYVVCNKCSDSYILRDGLFCAKPCDPGSYLDPIMNICLFCDSSCGTCNGMYQTDCLTCANE
jgi:hypothetical protein